MKALSIRQPWAWLILNAGKDIENRTWSTKFRGRIWVHAAKNMDDKEWQDAHRFAQQATNGWQRVPARFALRFGGIVGSVEIVDCVSSSSSKWFTGPYGLVLRDPRPVDFWPLRGQLGLFEVHDEELRA